MAAAGYAVSSFATSLPFGFFGGCAGAAGMAFDRDGNLFVVDEADGHLYKFGPAGGVANASTRVTAAPYPSTDAFKGSPSARTVSTSSWRARAAAPEATSWRSAPSTVT